MASGRLDPAPGGPVEWLTVFGERAGNALVYSSAYIAVVAAVYVSIAMVLLSLPPSPAPVVMGLVAFAVYTNDRLADVDADQVTNPGRTAFVRRHENALAVLAAAAYGLAVMLSVLGGPVTLAIALAPGAFWVLYATDWIPGVRGRIRRLKDVLVVNSAWVALAWALSATLLPIGFSGAEVTATAGAAFAYFFLRSFVNSEIPNVRDVDGDREAGVATLPVVFGVARTRHVLYAVDLLAIALVGYAALAGHLPALPAAALVVGLVYSLGVASMVGRLEDGRLLALAAEGEYVVVAVALAPIVYGF